MNKETLLSLSVTDAKSEETIIVQPKYGEQSERFVCDIQGSSQGSSAVWRLTITLSAPGCAWNRDGMTLHQGEYKSRFSALREIISWRDNAC